MFRFFLTCVLLAGGAAAAILYLAPQFFPPVHPEESSESAAADGPGKLRRTEAAARDTDDPAAARSEATPPSRSLDREVQISEISGNRLTPPLIIQGARVLAAERQEVPSERDGKLLFLATPVSRDEFVPKDKELWREVSVLGVEWNRGDEKQDDLTERRPVIPEPFEDPENPGKLYRFPRHTDSLATGTTKVIRLKVRFRKLAENDEVQEGQLLGVINPAVAVAELKAKETSVRAAEADVRATASMKEESYRRYQMIVKARTAVRGSITDDDLGAAKVTWDRYINEEVAKKAAVIKAQQEVSAAWTALDLYLIRAAIPGRIRTIYRQPGEAVKNLDPVLQIQNTRRLRIEAQVDVQDSLPLTARLKQAEAYRTEAREKDRKQAEYARKLRGMADELTAVEVELTRPVSPRSVLSGHLSEVTCVAVSRGPLPRIISGSEEGVVRVWERVPGDDRWQERLKLDHGVPIRAVACTGPGARKNLLATATSTGQVRVWDLDGLNSRSKPQVFGKADSARHQGAIATVAFSADGTLLASAGEDRSICIWNVAQGELLTRKPGAHRSVITSLAFAPDGRLVSAGRDSRLVVWKLEGEALEEIDDIRNRSNEVSVLGLDPEGKRVLFDEGRELRVLALEGKGIEGTLVNHGATGTFSTMALFSPDGKTILTNGNAPGRLQLWRAPTERNRPAELRQFLWASGSVTCGAFDPSGQFAVTGTTDHRVLVWELPRKDETEKPLPAELTYTEEFIDPGLKQVTVRVTLKNAPDWVIPGSTATIVLPSAQTR